MTHILRTSTEHKTASLADEGNYAYFCSRERYLDRSAWKHSKASRKYDTSGPSQNYDWTFFACSYYYTNQIYYVPQKVIHIIQSYFASHSIRDKRVLWCKVPEINKQTLLFETQQEAVYFKISAKYDSITLTKALLFRRRLTMMCPLSVIYVFIFISH